MARATVHCVCATCGKEFTHIKDCFNRKEADSYEEWASVNIDECPECRRARLKRENAERAAALIERYGFPEITGVSEKQIGYANDLRNKYLCKDYTVREIEIYDKIMRGMDDPEMMGKFRELADRKFEGSIEKMLKDTLDKYGLNEISAIRHESNASKILDALRDC